MSTAEELLCRSLPYGAGLASVGLWCSHCLPLKYVTCGGGRVVIWHSLQLSTGCTGSGASWELQGQQPHVPCLGPPGMNYIVICRWLLLVLGLEVPRRGQAGNQGLLLLVLHPGPLSKRHGANRPQAACLREFRKI